MFRIDFNGDQPKNIGNIQEFSSLVDLNVWIDYILSENILKELSIINDKIIFISFDNYVGFGSITNIK